MPLKLLLATLIVVALSIKVNCVWQQPHSLYYEPLKNAFTKRFITLSSDARSMNPDFEKEEPQERFRSRSGAARQDLMILKLFNDKPAGYFVDLNANHWEIDSNTYILEFYNKWKGLCIEPNPIYLEGLLSNRKCTIVTSPVGRTPGEIDRFRYHTNTETKYANSDEPRAEVPLFTRSIPSTTLTILLDEMKAPLVIDYLNFDVEGKELNVLLGLDSTKYTFLTITIYRPKENVHQLLSERGYRFVYQMDEFGVCLYMHQSKDSFVPLMKQYAQAEKVPEWHNSAKGYLLLPKWDMVVSSSDNNVVSTPSVATSLVAGNATNVAT